MNRAPATRMGVKLPDDVRRALEVWALDNVTSLTAEMVRSVRERRDRERKQQQRGATERADEAVR